jgi:predicted nucleic acid-binding protein
VIAALVKPGASRQLIGTLPLLMTIPATGAKVVKYKRVICEKSRMSSDDFDELLSLVMFHIEVVQECVFWPWMEHANRVMGAIDEEDVPFVALALARGAVVWSDDKHFQRQDKVKVFTTTELLHMIKND